jgi:hypothetical protein
MASEQYHNGYTAADIMRYHSGQMSEREMHAIEKAAMEDPFLEDALEGYLNTNTPKEDLAELRDRLFEKEKTKVVPFRKPYPMWGRIAAIFILVLGVGYMSYYFNSSKESPILAKNDTSAQNRSLAIHDSIKGANKDTGFIVSNNSTGSGRQEQKKSDYKTNASLPPPPSSVNTISRDSLRQSELASGNELKQMSDVAIAPPSARDKEMVGKVVDSAGKPVAYANIVNNKNKSTATDSTGKFKFKSNDSAMTVNIAAVGYNTRRAKLKNGKTIVLQPKQKYKEMVAVTDTKKKDRAAPVSDDSSIVLRGLSSKKAEEDLPRVIGIDSSFQPLKGWVDYNEHISDNRELFSKCKGQMVLSFVVDKRGYPIKINVERSLSNECDEKAIRLLRDGPKWKAAKDKRGKITLQF